MGTIGETSEALEERPRLRFTLRGLEALKLFRLAADNGQAMAAYNVAGFYYEGRGVRRDLAKAARWMRVAADGGDVAGQYRLGLMYANGEGVPKDPKEAEKWLSAAAAEGYEPAEDALRKLGP